MKDWKKTLLPINATIVDAMKIIDESRLQIALVVDDKHRLLGTITDGDIRRAVLRKTPLKSSVQSVMCTNPVVSHLNENRNVVWEAMKSKNLRQLPIVDDERCVIGLETIYDSSRKFLFDNSVIIMAGGMGTRLRPLTNTCPKPMLEVGGKPILETLIQNFSEYGFHKFFLSINYKGELIENYFKDGSDWGVAIKYLREKKPLGTAGSLSLLPKKQTLPIIIINGDILTKVNFNHLLNFHDEHKAFATMCVREYDFQVPFGVAISKKHHLVDIEEKPIHNFRVNAGIYVIDPGVLALIPLDTFCDMPTIFKKLVEQKKNTIVFPIHEYWLDLGRIEDMTRAQGEFDKIFK